jgi:hypothetical protein
MVVPKRARRAVPAGVRGELGFLVEPIVHHGMDAHGAEIGFGTCEPSPTEDEVVADLAAARDAGAVDLRLAREAAGCSALTLEIPSPMLGPT